MLGGLKRRIAGLMLLTILSIGTAMVFHAGFGGRHRPDCPPRQPESSSELCASAVSRAAMIEATVGLL